ncbi:hypothetical protein ACIQD2_00295 [Dietzia maris]
MPTTTATTHPGGGRPRRRHGRCLRLRPQGPGIYAADGGWELVAVIGLAVAVFGLVGTGRYSLDALIAGRRAARG